MKILVSALAAIAALSGADALGNCPTFTVAGTALNVPVGSTEAAGTGECICPSGQKIATASGTATACASYGATQCPTIPPASNTTTSLANMGLTTVDMAGNDQTVRLAIQMPMVVDRTFTKVAFAPAVTGPITYVESDCLSDAAFTSFFKDTPTACVENWNITAAFDKMRRCGFKLMNPQPASPGAGYQVYEGNVHVEFKEPTVIGTGSAFQQTVARSVSVDYPVRVAFDSNYVVPMSVNDVTVYAQQQIDFAITGQNIPKDPVTNGYPTADITYTIQYPYAIRSWGTISGAGNTIIPATVHSWQGATTPSLGAAGSIGTQCIMTTDYRVSDTGSQATCTKANNRLVFTTTANSDATCKFTGYVYTLPFNVRCGTDVPAADCPLAAEAPGSASFTITTENFCTGRAEADNIGNVITITGFQAYDVATYASVQTAWRWGDDLFMRMDFAGLPLQTITMSKLETKYSAEKTADYTLATTWSTVSATFVPGTPGAGQQALTAAGFMDDKDTAITSSNLGTGASATLGKWGLNAAGTQYRFKVVLGDALLGAVGSEPQRGADKFLVMRATIDVTYDRALRRRRRRQVTGGSGSKVSDTQTIAAPEPTEAAAAPNSAVRAAPAVALVLALLSAVALL